ncbi:MAG: GNAT family N-acetyltransferase [Gammaproteobacteria bacterium]|nr:GNAT family N-acetyltransferase [Gammaproteobacteria bacterium]
MIQAERLHLRQFTSGDLDYLNKLLSHPQTMQHWPAPLSPAEVQAWLERSLTSYGTYGFGRWLVVLEQSRQPIGDVGLLRLEVDGRLENDLGYIIHEAHWGQGFGVEAARACVEWAVHHGLASVVASMAFDNEPSIAVAEKLGMVRERTFRNSRNENKETYLYRLDLLR